MILWLIACGVCFVFGMLIGEGKFAKWVRGAAGKARDVVLGSRPAANSMSQSATSSADGTGTVPGNVPGKVSPPPANKTIQIGTALKNIAGFFVGLIAWCARNPMLALGLVVLALFLFFGAPSCNPFGKSRGELRLEREIAEANTRIAEHEARIGALSGQLAENTARDQRRVTTIIAQANEEIDHAVQAVDPDELYSVYRRAYDGVWHDLSTPSGANPAPSGPDRLPGAPANPA